MGQVLDHVIEHAPCDLVVVRDRGLKKIRRILVPTAGGPHTPLAARLALAIGRAHGAMVSLLYVCRPGAGEEERRRGRQMMERTLLGLETERPIERKTVTGEVVQAVTEEAQGYDLALVGATEESLFQRLLAGNIPKGIAEGCPTTVMMVKRRIDPGTAQGHIWCLGDGRSVLAGRSFAADGRASRFLRGTAVVLVL